MKLSKLLPAGIVLATLVITGLHLFLLPYLGRRHETFTQTSLEQIRDASLAQGLYNDKQTLEELRTGLIESAGLEFPVFFANCMSKLSGVGSDRV